MPGGVLAGDDGAAALGTPVTPATPVTGVDVSSSLRCGFFGVEGLLPVALLNCGERPPLGPNVGFGEPCAP
ncbi:hypothetical protein ACNQPY_13080 [Mycobacteroides abscessus]|uniref:hypothetical protein n=1 Tax=Mycobacteroides abscessus TaxID=36809 RepID=UPI003AADD11A